MNKKLATRRLLIAMPGLVLAGCTYFVNDYMIGRLNNQANKVEAALRVYSETYGGNAKTFGLLAESRATDPIKVSSVLSYTRLRVGLEGSRLTAYRDLLATFPEDQQNKDAIKRANEAIASENTYVKDIDYRFANPIGEDARTVLTRERSGKLMDDGIKDNAVWTSLVQDLGARM